MIMLYIILAVILSAAIYGGLMSDTVKSLG